MNPESKRGEKKLVTIKNTADLQRLKIDKLMKNPDKPALIPEPPKQKAIAPPPDFVRNVMGSSAGAGSGEFHVYRHLRRKEYSRQKFIQEKSEKEKLDEEYHKQIEENKKAAEEKTAKKRAKRLRKKRNARLKRKQPKMNINQQNVSSQSDTNSEDSEEGEDSEKSKDLTSIPSTLEDAQQGDNNSRNDEKALSDNENPNGNAIEKPVDDIESFSNKCNENISSDLREEQNENS